MASIPLDRAPTLTGEPEKIAPEDGPGDEAGGGSETKGSPPHFSRSLSSANFSPNGDLYDSLDEDWSMSYGTGELSLFDFLDSFSVVPSTLDKLNQRLKLQSKEVTSLSLVPIVSWMFRERLKTRIPSQYRERYRDRPRLDESIDKLKVTVNKSLINLQATWNDGKSVSFRDKIAFVSAVGNIFITALLLGMAPEKLPIWYTGQMAFFMPLRFFSYHRRGWHYFIADLCYWVNLMLVLFLWVFPGSGFLLIATYCLAYGSVAWAIIAWRNSLVFHSFEKVVSLFIHIMPPVVLHTILHLLPTQYSHARYPALLEVPHLDLWRGFWISSLVHTMWQGWYYIFIMVRRKEKIAAGRPTSFTWLRKSYAKTWIGKWVNRLPEALQPFAFMGIQYCYSLTTMIPCPLWYSSKVWSTAFVSIVFGWSVWNGACYYVDFFGKRFQKELEDLRAEVEKWQHSPLANSGTSTPYREIPGLDLSMSDGKSSGVEEKGEMKEGETGGGLKEE